MEFQVMKLIVKQLVVCAIICSNMLDRPGGRNWSMTPSLSRRLPDGKIRGGCVQTHCC